MPLGMYSWFSHRQTVTGLYFKAQNRQEEAKWNKILRPAPEIVRFWGKTSDNVEEYHFSTGNVPFAKMILEKRKVQGERIDGLKKEDFWPFNNKYEILPGFAVFG